jgi:hypothetical protein
MLVIPKSATNRPVVEQASKMIIEHKSTVSSREGEKPANSIERLMLFVCTKRIRLGRLVLLKEEWNKE